MPLNQIKIYFIFFVATVAMGCSAPKSAKTVIPHKKDNIETIGNTKPNQLPTSKKEVSKNQRPNNFKNEKEYDKFLINHYSDILNTPKSYIKNSLSLYKFVDMWLGTPYRYGGEDMNGIDCSGLVKTTYNEVFHQNITRDATSQFNQCESLGKEDLNEGDLVFFKIGSRNISHVGIYLPLI